MVEELDPVQFVERGPSGLCILRDCAHVDNHMADGSENEDWILSDGSLGCIGLLDGGASIVVVSADVDELLPGFSAR